MHGSQLAIGDGLLDVSVAARRLAARSAIGDVAPGSSATGGLPRAFEHRPRFGGAATYRLTARTLSAELRVLHAPGGAQSFARSGTEFAGSANQRVSRWFSAGGGGWMQSDDNQLVGRLRNAGWFASPTVMTPGGGLRVSVDGRGSSFLLTRPRLQYANAERMLGATADARRGWLLLRARSEIGATARRVTVDSSGGLPFTGTRQEHAATIGATGRRGTLDVTWSAVGTAGNPGVQPPQQSLVVRLDQARLATFARHWIVLQGEVQRLQFAPTVAPQWTASASLSVPLWAGFAITGLVDRNPFLSAGRAGRSVPLVYGLRLDQRHTVPTVGRRGGATRTLYVDENRNGRRDRGEPPLAGITVQCGADAQPTDLDGRFACARSDVQVDVRSLPLGIVPPAEGAAQSGDLAAVRVRPVSVLSQAPELDATRLTPDVLGRAAVTARDEAGLLWYARAVGGNQFVFDALPVGRYRLDVEQGTAPEAIATQSAVNELWVTRDGQSAPLYSTCADGPCAFA